MTTSTEHARRTRAQAWREAVAGFLAVETGREIRPRVPARRLSEELADAVLGDVIGVPGLTIATESAHRLRLSEALDVACRIAAEGESDGAVVVVKRHGRSTDEAYALLTLADFAALISRNDPNGVRP